MIKAHKVNSEYLFIEFNKRDIIILKKKKRKWIGGIQKSKSLYYLFYTIIYIIYYIYKNKVAIK